MALERFQRFHASIVPDAPGGEPAHLRVEEHGPVPNDRPSYVRGFLVKTLGIALLGAAGVGLGVGGADLGMKVSAMADQVTSARDLGYQVWERTVLGRQKGLDQQEAELKTMDARLYAQGVYTVRPTFSITYAHKNGATSAQNYQDGRCTLRLDMDAQGRMVTVGTQDGLVNSNDPTVIRNHRNFIYGHENAHCSFYKEPAPFRDSGLTASTEKFLNDWVFGSAAAFNDNPVRAMFNETQADVVGTLVMLHEANYSDAAWQEVEQDWKDRTARQNENEAYQWKVGGDPHTTARALRMLLDQRAHIASIPPERFRDVAYRLASHAVMQELNAMRVREVPKAPLDSRLVRLDDPMLNGQTVVGPLGWDLFDDQLNPVALRKTVSEQAILLRQEQLGLTPARPDLEGTQPRQMARQWLAQDNPFKPDARGVPALWLTADTNGEGVVRHWRGPNGAEGRDRFYSAQGGAPAFRSTTAFKAFRESVALDATAAEVRTALHADLASLLYLAQTAPRQAIDRSHVILPVGHPIAINIPNRETLGQKIDRTAQKTVVPDAAAPSPITPPKGRPKP